MPSWRKVIVSGSDASLNSLNVPSITGSLQGTASFATTASFVTPLNQNVSLTGSLWITGSTATDLVRITQTGAGNAFVVEDSDNPDATPFVIDASGNTMIGTTSSLGPLTVRGSGAIGVTLETDATANQENQSTRLFLKISGSGRDVSFRNLSGSLVIGTRATSGASSGTQVMFISASGDTGIGSGHSPSAARGATLQVSGNISIETGDAYKQDGSNVIYIAKGTDAFYANTIGGPGAGTAGLTRQTAYGFGAGAGTTGSNQTAIGVSAGYQNSGSSQTAVGSNAGQYNSGISQTAIGVSAGYQNSGSSQTAIGTLAGYQNSGSNQTAVGSTAGQYNTGINQTAVGVSAGFRNTGSSQTAVGSNAGYQNSGSNQTAVGVNAGYQNSGSSQTAVGTLAGYQNAGNDNTNIGYAAGLYTTGATVNNGSNQSVFLGSTTSAGGLNRTNQIVIGYNASGIGSNSVVLGNDSITTTALKGNVGIGTLTPVASLHVKPPAPTTDGQNSIMVETNAGRGINLISDLYNTTQSVTTFGRLQSSMAAFLAYGVNTTGSAVTGYQSSQDAFANRPTSLELGNAYFALKYNTSSLSRTYGTTVSMSTSLYMDGTSGRLGVGTQTPQAIFHVSSSGYNETYPFIVGFNQLVVSSSGNVGIGTTTPGAKFEIKSAAQNILGGLLFRASGSSNYPALIYEASNEAGVIELYSGSALTTRLFAGGFSYFNGGNVGIGTTTPSEKLHVSGNILISSSTTTTLNINSAAVRTYIASEVSGTAFGALSNHYVNFYQSGSIKMFIDNIGGNTVISGSLAVGTSSIGPNENTLTLGARDNANEGGQLGFNAPGGTYTSASFFDLYQNRLRLLQGTNAGSVSEVAWWSMHNKQMALPGYTSATSFPGTPAGFLAFDSSGNIITDAGAAINIGNTNLTITSNATRTLSHAGTSKFIITGSNSNSILELQSSTTGNGRGLYMQQLINAEPNRFAVRATTAGGNNADSTTHNGWASDHLIEYVSGSGVAASQVKGWKWSYFNGAAYQDVLIISTSNATTISGSLNVTGGITGSLQGTASFATTASFVTPLNQVVNISGSLKITGSLIVSGGLSAINTTTTNQSALIIASTEQNNALQITNTKPGGTGIYVDVIAPGLPSNATGIYTSVSGGSGQSAGIVTQAYGSPLAIGGQFLAGNGVISIGTDVYATGPGSNYSVRLQDGTEGIGKVLVAQTSDGKANWSTRLSGSYEITGSLNVTGGITGSLQGTASFATSASRAATASFANTASFVTQLNQNVIVTGSLIITGSTSGNLVKITQAGSGLAFVVEDITSPDNTHFSIDSSGSVSIGAGNPTTGGSTYSTKLYINSDISGFSGMSAQGYNNHSIIGNAMVNYAGVYGIATVDSGSAIPIYGKATDAGGANVGTEWIAGKFESTGDAGPGTNYAVQLIDGTQGAGKVLVSQTADGKANWSTRLSGSYEITGSLTVTDNLKSSGSTINTNALIQAGLLYLSNNF